MAEILVFAFLKCFFKHYYWWEKLLKPKREPPTVQPNYTYLLAMLTPLSAGFSVEFFSLFNFIIAAILYWTFVLCLSCFKMVCWGGHHRALDPPEHPRGLHCAALHGLQGHCLCSSWISTSNSSWKYCLLLIFGHMETSTLAHQFMVCSEARIFCTFCIHSESKI